MTSPATWKRERLSAPAEEALGPSDNDGDRRTQYGGADKQPHGFPVEMVPQGSDATGRDFFDLANKSDAPPLHGADQALRLSGIADRASRRGDPVGYRGIRYEAAMPHRPQQLAAADNPVGVLRQVEQQVEDLRLDGEQFASVPQFAAPSVKNVAFKRQSHAFPRPGFADSVGKVRKS